MEEGTPMKTAEILVRVILGMTFIVSGLLKLHDPGAFYGNILSFELISGKMAMASAYFVPWLELVCGSALLLRVKYNGALMIYGILIAAFSLSLLSALIRGVDIKCGCFGGSESTSIPLALLRNTSLLCGVIFLGLRVRRLSTPAGVEQGH